MIPRIIHQIWIGKENKKPSKLMSTWKKKNPSCIYIQWTDTMLDKFNFQNRQQIDEMDSLHGKAAIMRLELLYRCGGFYADADSECVNELDDFFFENKRFTCYENEEKGKYLGVPLLALGYVGCEPRDRIIKACIDEIGSRTLIGRPAHVFCGNLFFTTMVKRREQQYPMTIYPSHYFIPKHGTGVEYSGTDKVYSKHYWGSTFGVYDKL